MAKNRNRPRDFRIGHGGGAIQRSAVSPVTFNASDKSIRVSLGLLPPPDNVYDADTWWVARQAGHVALYFGQFSGSERARLRTRLKIKYPSEALLHHMWQHSRIYHADLKAVIGTYPEDPLKVPVVDISTLPVENNREHSNWANFDAMSRTASQAAIDFYHVAPPAAVKFMQSHDTRDITPSPVVRVLIGLYQQFEMLEKIETLIDDVRAMVPESHLALAEPQELKR